MAGSGLEAASAGLLGRERECAALEQFLGAASRAESRSLVVRGQPVIGKTTLLDYAAQHAAGTGIRVLRTAGVEAESELAFSGLYGLLRPIVNKLGELPEPQAAALGAALGIAEGTGSDRFPVSVAALGLIAAAAEDGPLVCVVDDAQWLDAASADALVFAAAGSRPSRWRCCSRFAKVIHTRSRRPAFRSSDSGGLPTLQPPGF